MAERIQKVINNLNFLKTGFDPNKKEDFLQKAKNFNLGNDVIDWNEDGLGDGLFSLLRNTDTIVSGDDDLTNKSLFYGLISRLESIKNCQQNDEQFYLESIATVLSMTVANYGYDLTNATARDNFVNQIRLLITPRAAEIDLLSDLNIGMATMYLTYRNVESNDNKSIYFNIVKQGNSEAFLFSGGKNEGFKFAEVKSFEEIKEIFSINQEAHFFCEKQTAAEAIGSPPIKKEVEVKLIERLIETLQNGTKLDESDKAILFVIANAFADADVGILTNPQYGEYPTKDGLVDVLNFLLTGKVDHVREAKLKACLSFVDKNGLNRRKNIFGSANSFFHEFFYGSRYTDLASKDLFSLARQDDFVNKTEIRQKILSGNKYCVCDGISGGHYFGLVFEQEKNKKRIVYIQDSTEQTTPETEKCYDEAIEKIFPTSERNEVAIEKVKTISLKTGDSMFAYNSNKIESQCRYSAIIFSERVLEGLKNGQNFTEFSIKYGQQDFEKKFAEWYDKFEVGKEKVSVVIPSEDSENLYHTIPNNVLKNNRNSVTKNDNESNGSLQVHSCMQEEVLQNIKNYNSPYDVQAINFLISLEIQKTNDATFVELGSVELDFDSEHNHETRIAMGITQFSREDIKKLLIPLNPLNKNGSIRGHFTALYVQKEESGYKVAYIDPEGNGKVEDIPEHVKSALTNFLGINSDQIVCTKNKIQHSEDGKHWELEDGQKVFTPPCTTNHHCGAFVVHILSQLASGCMRIKDGMIEQFLNGEYEIIPDLDKEQSSKLGANIRELHTRMIMGEELNDPTSTIKSNNINVSSPTKDVGEDLVKKELDLKYQMLKKLIKYQLREVINEKRKTSKGYKMKTLVNLVTLTKDTQDLRDKIPIGIGSEDPKYFLNYLFEVLYDDLPVIRNHSDNYEDEFGSVGQNYRSYYIINSDEYFKKGCFPKIGKDVTEIIVEPLKLVSGEEKVLDSITFSVEGSNEQKVFKPTAYICNNTELRDEHTTYIKNKDGKWVFSDYYEVWEVGNESDCEKLINKSAYLIKYSDNENEILSNVQMQQATVLTGLKKEISWASASVIFAGSFTSFGLDTVELTEKEKELLEEDNRINGVLDEIKTGVAHNEERKFFFDSRFGKIKPSSEELTLIKNRFNSDSSHNISNPEELTDNEISYFLAIRLASRLEGELSKLLTEETVKSQTSIVEDKQNTTSLNSSTIADINNLTNNPLITNSTTVVTQAPVVPAIISPKNLQNFKVKEEDLEEKFLTKLSSLGESFSAIDAAKEKMSEFTKIDFDRYEHKNYVAKSVLSKAIKAEQNKGEREKKVRREINQESWNIESSSKNIEEGEGIIIDPGQKAWYRRFDKEDFKGVDFSKTLFMTRFVDCTFDENCKFPDLKAIKPEYFSNCKFHENMFFDAEGKPKKSAKALATNLGIITDDKKDPKPNKDGYFEVGKLELRPNKAIKPIASFALNKEGIEKFFPTK